MKREGLGLKLFAQSEADLNLPNGHAPGETVLCMNTLSIDNFQIRPMETHKLKMFERQCRFSIKLSEQVDIL